MYNTISKEVAIPLFNKLNKVIDGSSKVINNFENEDTVNVIKALRACFINSKLIAEVLKTIVFELSKNDTSLNNSNFNLDQFFSDVIDPEQ